MKRLDQENVNSEVVSKLKSQIDKLEIERDETIAKFQENETLWA